MEKNLRWIQTCLLWLCPEFHNDREAHLKQDAELGWIESCKKEKLDLGRKALIVSGSCGSWRLKQQAIQNLTALDLNPDSTTYRARWVWASSLTSLTSVMLFVQWEVVSHLFYRFTLRIKWECIYHWAKHIINTYSVQAITLMHISKSWEMCSFYLHENSSARFNDQSSVARMRKSECLHASATLRLVA